jgi:hypothetical protein
MRWRVADAADNATSEARGLRDGISDVERREIILEIPTGGRLANGVSFESMNARATTFDSPAGVTRTATRLIASTKVGKRLECPEAKRCSSYVHGNA